MLLTDLLIITFYSFNFSVIEKFTDNVRFCIICNYLSKIIPALQSRCTRFRFGPLDSKQILPRLQHVVDEEKYDIFSPHHLTYEWNSLLIFVVLIRVNITDDGAKALITLGQGDMRKVLNVLQSTHMAYGEVTEDNVYTCVGHPLKSDITNIVKWLLNENFTSAYKKMTELKLAKGLALHDILTEVHVYVHRIELPSEVLVHLLIKMSDIERRLVSGTSEDVQLSSLIAAFQPAREN